MASSFARPLLTDQIAAHMTRMIAEAQWPAGTILPPEADLALQFGVSRTVIRECVRVLASRGMLEVKQGRGTSVLPPADWNVAEPLALLVQVDRSEMLRWLEVRTILEVESAALAALRATALHHEALRAALDDLETSTANVDAYTAADVRFHLTVAEAAQNLPLVRILRPVVQPLREHLRATVLMADAQHAANIEHRAIMEHIVAGEVTAAREAMAAHLARVAEEITAILQR
jgi:DNA-binding FadR family transcriptional regulator